MNDSHPIPAERGVTVVVPALDEQDAIGVTLERALAALASLDVPWEIIVVDDGSRDATAEIARGHARVRVLSHPQPGGYGRALKTGIRAARFDVIAITDADGTYPVEEIPTLVALLARYDMVVAARTGRHYRRTALLSPMRTCFLLLSSFVTGTWIPDPNSGLRVFRRDDVLPLLPELPRAFSFTTTLTLVMTLAGRFVHYHRVPYMRRIGRSKVRLFRDALRTGQTLVEFILLHNPLKIFLLLSAVPFLASLVLFALQPCGGSTIGGFILIATSILVLTAGMLAVVVLGRRSAR